MATLSEAMTMAARHHQAGRLQDVEQICRQVLAIDSQYAAAWNLLGVVHSQSGNQQAASDCLCRAIALDPNAAAFHCNLGNVHGALHRPREAIACYRRALELKPDLVVAHNNLANALLEQRQPEQAIASYRRALELNPNYFDACINLGNALKDQENFDDAIACYRRALELKPNAALAHNNLANIFLSQGQLNDAILSYHRALELDPRYAEAHNNLGNALKELGRLDEAIACYYRARDFKPNLAAAHNNLANALQEQDRLDEAVACYRRALELNPDYAEAYNNLGNTLQKQGHTGEAIVCLRKALELKPGFAEPYNNLGNALQSQRKLDEAITCYRRALELKPNFVMALNNLGNAFKDQGNRSEAVAHYRQAISLKPDSVEPHHNLGNTLKEQGQLDEAVTCYRRALGMDPDYAEAHYNLGNALQGQEKPAEAIDCYRRALELKPDYLAALGALVHELQHVCDWRGLTALSQRVVDELEADPENAIATPLSPFSFLTLPTVTTAEQQLRCARLWADRHLKLPVDVRTDPTVHRASNLDCKITVGYLSADFHLHATAMLMAELFEKHDRRRFAVFGYSCGRDDDSPMRRRLVNAFDRFVDIKDASYLEAAQRITADKVDILVDLKGYTLGARTQILGHRPAPIQISYLGYPGTMGTSFIDYILVDDFIVPAEQQPFFTEKLVRLPGCYQVNDSQREISPHTPSRAECGLPDAGFVFCCFNNGYKITPDVFDVWMRLLRSLPDSVLWLLEGNRSATTNLRREAQSRGVAPERLVFAPRLPPAEHLARHRLADLFLDTFPVNAHTAASDALWAGCPLLTVAGDTFVSRVAGSLLRTLGLPELITTDLDAYEQTAACLARDTQQLAVLRARLQTNRTVSALFDAKRFAVNVETAYATMWRHYLAGDQPSPFRVPPECEA